jgi:prephenate dehydratase
MIRVAFQGVRGAFSEDAIYQFFGEGTETMACPDFESVFRAVDTSEATHGMVPVENSLEGSVTAVNDLLLENDLNVVGEALVAVNHCLIVLPPARLEDIRRVYSHPQALGQCRGFLSKYPQWQKVPAYDTAGSVQMVKESGRLDEAAIASCRAAEVYGMKVLREGIQNSDDNFTRFFVISHTALQRDGDKTSLVFATRNVPGALHEAMGCFAERGINMTRVESRPRKGRAWEYVFYVDIDGAANDPKVAAALAALVSRAAFVKVLGTYRRAKPL